MRIAIFIFVIFFFPIQLFCQNKNILDSLFVVQKNANDTIKIRSLLEVAALYQTSKPDSAIYFAQNALDISEKVGFQKGYEKSSFFIASCYDNQKKYQLALIYYQKSLKMQETLNMKVAMALSLNNIGNMYYFQASYPLALDFYHKSLKLREELKDMAGMAKSLNNIGLIYQNRGNYPEALEYLQKSMKIREDLKDKHGVASSLNNIGLLYNYQLDYNLSLEYHQKSMAIYAEINDMQGVGMSLNNIGLIYEKMNSNKLAMECFKKSLQIREERKDKPGIASTLHNIALIYYNQKEYLLALEYYKKSLSIKESLNDKRGMALSLNGIAITYQKQKDYEKSIEYGLKGLQIAKEIKILREINTLSQTLYNTYKLMDNSVKALEYHELFKQSNDSLFNVEKEKSIVNLESKVNLEKKEKELILLSKDNLLNKLSVEKKAKELEIIKKQAEAEHLFALAQQEKDKRKADSLLNLAQKAKLEADKLQVQKEKQDILFKAEIEQQKYIQYAYMGVITMFLIVLVLVGIGFKQKQKANYLLAQQNDEILNQKKLVSQKNDNLNHANSELKLQQEKLIFLNENLEGQKVTLESTYDKLKHTTEQLDKSIHYASRVQSIVMPEETELRQFFSDIFILFRPKDVVSGDFYWFSQISEDTAVFSLSDCTGHGVPGAFMSMLGSTILHETVNVKQVHDDPARILKNVHNAIRKILKQDQRKNNDGMDISLCIFKKNRIEKTVEFTFAGAKSRMTYVLNGEAFDLKGDKQYLGGEVLQHDFTNHHLILPENTQFYLYSDGYQDQNNDKRKRIGSATFKEALLATADKGFALQKSNLELVLDEHKKNEEQRDDISVIGLRI